MLLPKYLYLNDGKKANQVLCKICGHLGFAEHVRRQSQAKRKLQKFDFNYKQHYQYREYQLKSEDLQCHRPTCKAKVDLSEIHNSYHMVGLVLTFFVKAGLPILLTRDLLQGIFGIKLSHQTVINYVNAAAALFKYSIFNQPWKNKFHFVFPGQLLSQHPVPELSLPKTE